MGDARLAVGESRESVVEVERRTLADVGEVPRVVGILDSSTECAGRIGGARNTLDRAGCN